MDYSQTNIEQFESKWLDPDYDMADWVLGKLQGEDKKTMDAAVKRAADAIECLLKEGTDKAMNKFN